MKKKRPVLRWKFLARLCHTEVCLRLCWLLQLQREYFHQTVSCHKMAPSCNSIFKVSCFQLPYCWRGNRCVQVKHSPCVCVNFSSPSKRCTFSAISVTRIHVLRNYCLLYPWDSWDLASWSLNCWRQFVCAKMYKPLLNVMKHSHLGLGTYQIL